MPDDYRICRSRTAWLVAAILTTSACQPTVEQRFSDAEDYMARGDFRSAVIELKNVLQDQPGRTDARLMLADASYILNDLEVAESEYRRLLASDGAETSTWVSYGRALLAQGKAAEALEKVEPNLGEVRDGAAAAVVGDIYRALGNLETASGYYATALEIDPADVHAMIGEALVAAGNGDLERALGRLDAALESQPADALVLRSRADVLGASRRFSDAVETYDRAIAAETTATPYFQQYLARQNRIAALIEARELDKAAESLDAFAELLPDYPLVAFLRGQIAFGRGDYTVAESELLRYLARVPNDARGQAILGAIKFSQNNLGQAEQYLSSAVRAEAGGETTRRLLAETLLRLNQPQDAIDVLTGEGGAGARQDAVTLAMLGRAKLGRAKLRRPSTIFSKAWIVMVTVRA